MKISLDLDITILEKELISGLQSRFDSAYNAAANTANQDAQSYAQSELKKGLKNWEDGYSFKKVSNNVFVMALSGKLASMMEDGIQVGEISKMIMNGNRAKHNAQEGKDYVDVPIPLDSMEVSFHRDADSMMASFQRKEVKLSDWKNGGIKKEDRLVKRLSKTAIESKKSLNDENPAFLTIRRVNKNSVWPKNPFPGVKAFERVARDFADNVIKNLEASL